MMLTCKQTSELISARYDRKLRLTERVSMRLHLMMCRYCHAVARQIDLIQKLTGLKSQADVAATSQTRLSDSARHRIEDALRKADSD